MEYLQYGFLFSNEAKSPLPKKELEPCGFRYMESIVIPKTGNVFIADIPFSTGWESEAQQLAVANNRDLYIYDGYTLTQGLVKLLSTSALKDDSTALLFPGNGAGRVLTYLQMQQPEVMAKAESENRLFTFPCSRKMENGECKSITGGVPDSFNPQNFNRIVIIDDVTASRETAERLSTQLFDLNGPPLSPAETLDDIRTVAFRSIREKPDIDVYSWLALQPSRKTVRTVSSGITGVRSLNCVVNYSGEVGTVPCNTVSTFLRGDKKATGAIQALCSKYFSAESFERFLSTINSPRSLYG